jgi:hypothetical protein
MSIDPLAIKLESKQGCVLLSLDCIVIHGTSVTRSVPKGVYSNELTLFETPDAAHDLLTDSDDVIW